MVGSVLVNGVLGLVYCLVLLFSLGDLTTLLATPTGFPFIQLFYNVTQSNAGATVMSVCITLIAMAANAAGLTSTSRTFWSFARDSAIPFSTYYAHVDTKLKVPVRMIVLVSILQALLGFIYLGNTTAFNAILSMSILGMYLSYLLPIVYMIMYRRKLRKFGVFRMSGTVGLIVNIVAAAWLIFAMIFSTLPSYEPVTAQNMNYSTVVLGGWVFFGVVYFFIFGRKQYNGPLIEGGMGEVR